jgi:ribonuclease P protein component
VGSTQELTARLGVVVPKRLIKAAVRRNLIKRLGREQFRLLLKQLPVRDLVLRLAVKPGKLNRKELAEEIRKLLLKLNAAGR